MAEVPFEALTWENWNRRYKNEFVEFMILLDANIGNPDVLSVDGIPVGGRRFSEVFNGLLSSLDDLVQESANNRYLARSPLQLEAATLSRLAERRIQEWNARTERVKAWNEQCHLSLAQGQAFALFPEYLDQLTIFDGDDLRSLIYFVKYYMHLTGELIAIGRRDFEAARRAMLLLNRNGSSVNCRTILLFYRFWGTEEAGVHGHEINPQRPTEFHEEYNPEHPFYVFIRNTQLLQRNRLGAESAEITENAQGSETPENTGNLGLRIRVRSESTAESGEGIQSDEQHEQPQRSRRPRHQALLRERQAVYGPYDEQTTTHGVYCTLCCEVHDLYKPDGLAMTRLPCGHMFCVEKINEYCQRRYAERVPMVCPLCRRPFFNGGPHN